tara:strand:+ start:124 stop:513 length:390 start_codon:yes stop_codon:yes gene_type:complete
MKTCAFCNINKKRIIAEDDNFFVVKDIYPVTDLHTLIITKKHIQSFFDLDIKKQKLCIDVVNDQRKKLLLDDSTITGFNVGINIGKDAGQTVEHCHIHIIPRRKGDMNNPKGGVRGVIPGKQNYEMLDL